MGPMDKLLPGRPYCARIVDLPKPKFPRRIGLMLGDRLHLLEVEPELLRGLALGDLVEFILGGEGAPATLVPVHPTQLYEIAWLLPVAGFLWWRRKKSPFLFGEYVALNGIGRLFIENWRVNERVALGLTEPQWIGLGLLVLGMSGWGYYQRQQRREAGA